MAAPGSARACSEGDQYIGSVCLVAFTYCPQDYAEAAGQIVAISEYNALFALLGTTYGGDGRTTFALPDLRGRVPVGLGAGSGFGPVELGQKRGAERRTLTVNELPTHTHQATATFNPQGGAEVKASGATADRQTAQAGDFLGSPTSPGTGGTPVNLYTGNESNPVALGGVSGGGGTVTVTNQNTGGSQPLETLDPGLGMRYCIALEGLYPPRP
jgi:microcystin-dependent protein